MAAQRSPTRRRIMAAAWASACLGAVGLPAHAQNWPSRPVKMIVPFPAGTAPDVVARLLSDQLTRAWGQMVIVENRPGAGGIPGMVALSRSAPDGYTIGLVPAAAATLTPYLYKNPQYNFEKDVIPVASVGTGPMMIVVNANSEFKTIGDLFDYSRSHAGKVNFAAAQTNSVPHLTGEMLSKLAGLNWYSVPYQGSQAAVTAVIAGEATVTMDGMPGVLPHVKGGKLRALAVTSDKRLPGFENVPTMAESVKGFESIGWFGVYAPTGTPATLVDQVNRDVNKALSNPELVARYGELGIYPKAGTPTSLKDFVTQQQALFKAWIADLGLQPQ